jgi:TolB protein
LRVRICNPFQSGVHCTWWCTTVLHLQCLSRRLKGTSRRAWKFLNTINHKHDEEPTYRITYFLTLLRGICPKSTSQKFGVFPLYNHWIKFHHCDFIKNKMRYLTNTLAILIFSVFAQLLIFTEVSAQWTNRYAKLNDFGHHVYLEQHELPILAYGPTDPAPAPDGKHLAFAARGWLWNLNLETGTALRLTKGPGIDSRPRWSPDGKLLAFVRDEGKNTAIIVRELANGQETRIDTEAIELDPEFSADGNWIYYTSGVSGSLNLRRRQLTSGADEQLTELSQVERNSRSLANSESLMYLHGTGAHRVLRIKDFKSGTDTIAVAQTLTYHFTADAHPIQNLIVYSAPIDNDYHLWTMDLNDPRVKHRLTDGNPFALTPAFSADGNQVYFVELDENRQFRLMQIATYGGSAKEVKISNWNLGEATGTLNVSIKDATGKPITARVSIVREDGYPVAFHEEATYVDPQTGRHYFYLEGEAQFNLPVGNYKVTAVRGPMTPIMEATSPSNRKANQ